MHLPYFSSCAPWLLQGHIPFFIDHLQAHLDLPGPLSAGSVLADAATQLVFPVFLGSVPQAA